jgi:hypothetical protein
MGRVKEKPAHQLIHQAESYRRAQLLNQLVDEGDRVNQFGHGNRISR